MQFREALQFAILSGNKAKQIKGKIAAILWPNGTAKSGEISMTNLIGGKTKLFSKKTIVVFCEKTGVSPNFLYNYNEETKTFNHE
jgi:hypothetical protein